MRCENCGRPMMNTELWQLGSDPKAPTSRSMRTLCWECRKTEGQGTQATTRETRASITAEQDARVRARRRA